MSTTKALKTTPDAATLNRFALFAALAIVIYTVTITVAYAATSPMGVVMCRVLEIIYGNLGRATCTLAVVIVGVGATLGKVSWGLAITVATGIAAIFGSAAVASYLLTGAGLGLNSIAWAQAGCP